MPADSTTPTARSATRLQIVRRVPESSRRELAVIAYFSAIARRSSVVTRVASAMMNAISLLVVMKRAPFLMYSVSVAAHPGDLAVGHGD
jgi:hypothetical protein